MRKTIELTHEVKLFCDAENTAEQSVFLELPEKGEFWTVIEHGGSEISLSVENFKKLIELFNNAINVFEKTK